LLLEF